MTGKQQWVVDEEDLTIYVVTDAGRQPILYTHTQDETRDMDEATARLAASTPDLLEALKNCVSLVRLKFGNTDEGANAAQEQAYAAIARAEGRK